MPVLAGEGVLNGLRGEFRQWFDALHSDLEALRLQIPCNADGDEDLPDYV